MPQRESGDTDDAAAETELRRAAIGDVRAHEVEIEQSAVRSVHAEEFEAEQSAVLFARAGTAEIENSAVGILVAREVEAESLTAAFVLAPVVRGNVRTLFDLRTAFAMGAGYFVARRTLRAIGDVRRAVTGGGCAGSSKAPKTGQSTKSTR